MAKSIGRPTEYKPEYDKLVVKLCRLGAIDREIADFFEVSEQTINSWKEKHPSFLESIKKGKIDSDATVSQSLFRRAKGFRYSETTKEMGVETKRVIKYMPPDPTAAIFWLKNRRSKEWRDKQEVAVVNGEDQVFVIGGKQIKF